MTAFHPRPRKESEAASAESQSAHRSADAPLDSEPDAAPRPDSGAALSELLAAVRERESRGCAPAEAPAGAGFPDSSKASADPAGPDGTHTGAGEAELAEVLTGRPKVSKGAPGPADGTQRKPLWRRKGVLAAAAATGVVGVVLATVSLLVSGGGGASTVVNEAPNSQGHWPDAGAPGPVDLSSSGGLKGSNHSPGAPKGPDDTPDPGKSQAPTAGKGGDQRGATAGAEDGGQNGGSTDQSGSVEPPASGDSPPPVTESDAGSNPVGLISLTYAASGNCVDIIGDFGRPDGSKLQLWQCSGTDWQHWEFMSDHTLRSLDKCMDVIGGSAAAGAGVDWTTCTGADSQQFGMNKSGGLVNLASGTCVMPTDGQSANGTLLSLAACGSQGAQKWSAS